MEPFSRPPRHLRAPKAPKTAPKLFVKRGSLIPTSNELGPPSTSSYRSDALRTSRFTSQKESSQEEPQLALDRGAEHPLPRHREISSRLTPLNQQTDGPIGKLPVDEIRQTELAHPSRHLGVLKALNDLPELAILPHSGKKRVVSPPCQLATDWG